MKTVKEVSQLTGVSVRTLHHYDAIGLLHPTRVTDSGYRLYDDTALRRLNAILLLRELEFPLKEIGQILDSPGFDPIAALEDQIRLLELKREHLDQVIAHARSIQKTGVIELNFKPYDNSAQERYAAEAKERWGKTDAYREYEAKGKSQKENQFAGEAMMDIFREMGQIRDLSPDAPEAQALAAKLQNHITANYYTCTKQILAGLGQMYVADDRFRANIDATGGEGTAEFAGKVIAIYTAE